MIEIYYHFNRLSIKINSHSKNTKKMKKVTYKITKALKLNLLKAHPFAEMMYHVGDIDILAKDLEERGLLTKIIVDQHGTIISGRRRAEAAKKLNWDEIEAHVLDDLTEEQTEQLIIAYNQQRKKVFSELLSEARYVIGTLGKSQGKERVLIGLDGDENFGKISSDRFALAAKYIGADIAGPTLRRLLYVDNYETENPDAGLGLIEKISKRLITINKAYDMIQLHKERKDEGGGGENGNLDNLSNPDNYKIIAGSCRNMKEMMDDSVSLIATSIPYYNLRDYRTKDEQLADANNDDEQELGKEATPELFIENLIGYLFEMKRVLKNTGSIALNVGDTYDRNYNNLITHRVIMAACDVVGLHLVNELIFVKERALPQNTDRRLQPTFERVLHFVKDVKQYHYTPFKVADPDKKMELGKINRPNKDGGVDEGDWSLSKPYKKFKDFISLQDQADIFQHCLVTPESIEMRKLDPKVKHPAPYSTCLMLLPMLCTTKPGVGEIVLDPFGGTGSTLVTAVLMGRIGVMYEKQDRFAKLADKRLKAMAKNINPDMAAIIENAWAESEKDNEPKKGIKSKTVDVKDFAKKPSKKKVA